jgi:predicted metal-dependent hydrolase
MQQLTLKTRAGPVQYTVTSRPRVSRRLYMELDERGGLVVVAPAHWPIKFVAASVARNIPRVEKFLATASGRHASPLQYGEGEKHLYLGRTHPLVVHGAAAKQPRVAVIADELHVWVPVPTSANIKTTLQNWYSREAGAVFRARLAEVSRRAPWAHGKQVLLKQRRMKRSWGNCSPGGAIKLNTHLVKAPVNLIDSVIAHELCHLQEMSHGPVFYTLLQKLNPDWKQDRASLRAERFNYLRT